LARHNKRFTIEEIEEIIKTVATRCQILRLKCTKSFVGWGPLQTPLGELTALPRPPRGILLRGGEGTRGEGREGERKGGAEGRDGGGEGAGSAPKLKLAPRTIFLAV